MEPTRKHVMSRRLMLFLFSGSRTIPPLLLWLERILYKMPELVISISITKKYRNRTGGVLFINIHESECYVIHMYCIRFGLALKQALQSNVRAMHTGKQ